MDELTNALKKRCNTVGGALLIYKVIMNVAVFAVIFISAMAIVILSIMGSVFETVTNEGLLPEGTDADISGMVEEAMTNSMGWGYLLAVFVGFLILLLWKKPAYMKQMLTQRGRPMKVGDLLLLLCLCSACQLIIQIVVTLAEAVYHPYGFSLMGLMESAGAGTDELSMLLYIGIFGPVTEELLFRGLMIKELGPYGKGFAVVASAILFGFFHGSPVQTPFAILMGLLLGYVAVEYNIWWAILLHIFNNLFLGDVLPRLLENCPGDVANIVMYGVMIGSGVVAASVAWVKRRKLPGVLEVFRSEDAPWRVIVKAPCIVIVLALSLVDMATMAIMLVFMNG